MSDHQLDHVAVLNFEENTKNVISTYLSLLLYFLLLLALFLDPRQSIQIFHALNAQNFTSIYMLEHTHLEVKQYTEIIVLYESRFMGRRAVSFG